MKHILPIITLLLLTACTSYKEGFDCEAAPGVGCKSIAEVDHLIDQGKIGAEEERNSSNSEETSKEVTVGKQQDSLNKTRGVHVWIAPYSDDEGVWHGSHSLFVPFRTNEKGEI
ncbi:MAG: hypothetical protein BGO76_00975 [Caedibacter sp. 38-128]|nr:hypothetical protein [Holosporales bacterium]OJX06102.1 MAG: hypothetical protein BGO76_00975 [Caedibacter sp. 38-128]